MSARGTCLAQLRKQWCRLSVQEGPGEDFLALPPNQTAGQRSKVRGPMSDSFAGPIASSRLREATRRADNPSCSLEAIYDTINTHWKLYSRAEPFCLTYRWC